MLDTVDASRDVLDTVNASRDVLDTVDASRDVLDTVDESRDGGWALCETGHPITDPEASASLLGLMLEADAGKPVPSQSCFISCESSKDVAAATVQSLEPVKTEPTEVNTSNSTLPLSPTRRCRRQATHSHIAHGLHGSCSEDEEWSVPSKRTRRVGQKPSRADNARRRISSMTSSRAERVRRLARQATERRKAQKDRATEQAVLRLAELDKTYQLLQAERETLEVQCTTLRALILHLRNG
jgi:hypothetical protein